MSKTRKRIAVLVSGLALLGGGITAATTIAPEPARAAGCYDSAKSFQMRSGSNVIPTGDGWWKTTSNCNDINIKRSVASSYPSRQVRVCFQRTGCQSGWTSLPRGEWRVVASNVKDGTKYKLELRGVASGPAGMRAD